mgnify:CR=1 FL=1
MSKQLLLGDEAIAQAALDAGLSGVYAYPGTPSTEITEYIQMAPITTEQNIHNRWCTNEKTAMEAALGMSFVGKRALVCMKHVGMNVAADCFVNSAITGVKQPTTQACILLRTNKIAVFMGTSPLYRCMSPATSRKHTICYMTDLNFQRN